MTGKRQSKEAKGMGRLNATIHEHRIGESNLYP